MRLKKYFAALILLILVACDKDFLKKDPSSDFVKADDLRKLSGLLKDQHLMAETPVLGEVSSDDYYLDAVSYQALPAYYRNAYAWQKEIFGTEGGVPDWNSAYAQVYNANVVLEKISAIAPDITQEQLWNQTAGAAYFMRAFALFNIAQVFAAPFDEGSKEPGISIPLSTDISAVPPRSSLAVSYNQIIQDLEQSVKLLPAKALSDTLPGRAAGYALLARVYLSMRSYSQALAAADSSLSYQHTLINYNNLKLGERFPIPVKNEETLYLSWMISTNPVIQGRIPNCAIVDSTLYKKYDQTDLRLKAFFVINANGQPVFRGSYASKSASFSGLAVDETLLIRAECYARQGALQQAAADINLLWKHRYQTGKAPSFTPTTTTDALNTILLERRKELLFRGLRWLDLRRLNLEEAGVILTRIVEGNTHQLLPGSKNYVLQIPPDALVNSPIVPNIRE